MQMKITTLPDGSQAQYIKVTDSIGVQWLSNVDTLTKSMRPQDAIQFTPKEALATYNRLVGLGYKGLSITNGLPVDDVPEAAKEEIPAIVCYQDMDATQKQAFDARQGIRQSDRGRVANTGNWRSLVAHYFGNWAPGDAVAVMSEIKTGDILFCESLQFDAVNLCKVASKDESRGICYAQFINPFDTTKGRFSDLPEREFGIWENELQGSQRHFYRAINQSRG